MTILVADNIETNSYVTSLVEAYKKTGHQVLCGLHNFFYSNFKPDMLHIQWPEKLYSWYPFSRLNEQEKYDKIEERLKWYRENKVFIVHTIHNIKPHIPAKLDFEEKIFKLVINYSDLLSHHCKRSIELLKEIYPAVINKKNIANHLGDYLIDFKNISKVEARKKLGISLDKYVILNFGSQQKYKGENFIESVFNKLQIKNKFLLTGGSYRYFGYGRMFTILKMIKNFEKVHLFHTNKKYYYRAIHPDEVSYFFSSSDLVFMAHTGSLNSGILSMAATYSKPVVFPNIGCFKEQMESWNYRCYDNYNIKDAIKGIENFYYKNDLILDNSEWLSKNSWEKHVELICNSIGKIQNKEIL